MMPCVCQRKQLECDCELSVCDNDTPRQFPRALITVLMITAVVALVAAHGCTRKAHARYGTQYAQQSPETQAWFKAQHNAKGEWCCDETDGHAWYSDYTMNEDGSVTLQYDGAPHMVASEYVLKGANPTGHAIYWFRVISGVHRDYCFSPGSLS